jgi:hypothetical protein
MLIVCGASFALSVVVSAQRGGGGGGGNNGGGNNAIASLKGVAIPQPPGIAQYVANQQSLIVLGKALFWDAQVGSDGRIACATCHFHAGADHRITNQIAGPATSLPTFHSTCSQIRGATVPRWYAIAATSLDPQASYSARSSM